LVQPKLRNRNVQIVKKETRILDALMVFIQETDLGPGDRLPAERALAQRFGASRHTLRSALRRLEADGSIQIRAGSGCYVASPESPLAHGRWGNDGDANERLRGYMEARYILEPVIGTVAAEKATAADVGELENGLMRISRAMMTGGIDKVDEEHRLLQYKMAACTRNSHLERIGRQLAGERCVFCRTRGSIQKTAHETLFSTCVAIVKAIKHKDPALAAQRVREHILQDARQVKPADRFLLPPLVRSALEIKPE